MDIENQKCRVCNKQATKEVFNIFSLIYTYSGKPLMKTQETQFLCEDCYNKLIGKTFGRGILGTLLDFLKGD